MISYKMQTDNMSQQIREERMMTQRAFPELDNTRLTILVGFSGSGKTECAVNLALALQNLGHPTALADLDVVNPYFRSRERRELLQQHNIRLVATSQACVDADVPALPAELNTLLQDEGLFSVLDIGGGPVGARVLARYRPKLLNQPHRVCFVLNANRPGTGTAEKALNSLREIEATLGLPATHIIHNTHLCRETTPEDILAGAELAREVSASSGLPILCHTAHEPLIHALSPLNEPVLPLRLYMNKPWEEEEDALCVPF